LINNVYYVSVVAIRFALLRVAASTACASRHRAYRVCLVGGRRCGWLLITFAKLLNQGTLVKG